MKLVIKEQAIVLRKKGYSLKEIAEKLSVAKSTVSLWTRDIKMSKSALKRLESKVKKAVIISAQRHIAVTNAEREYFFRKAAKLLDKNLDTISKDEAKLYTALLYWCEGTKSTDNLIKFANSDPKLVKFFLTVFRRGFDLQLKKFRAMMHLHEYHIENRQIKFWAKITGIPTKQFYRSYQKPHTGKRIKPDYPGCITINYYDKIVAREIFGLIKAFGQIEK
ncbi:helix-turn-helix domain-containing protein [Patescibacteria group bacterium]|nr:helix-turn-helix domain-containing protein [Patescibacteria group bacterium]